jgi:hypothetical protein
MHLIERGSKAVVGLATECADEGFVARGGWVTDVRRLGTFVCSEAHRGIGGGERRIRQQIYYRNGTILLYNWILRVVKENASVRRQNNVDKNQMSY